MKKVHTHGGDVYRHQNALDFSSNCNPFGTPEGVKRAIREGAEMVCHYPDVECEKLKKALAREEQVKEEHLIFGNGAADLIFSLVLAKKPKRALLLAPSFAEYEQALRSVGCEISYVYLQQETGFVPGEELLSAVDQETDLVFFCNPNNPTGTLSERDYVRRLAKKCGDCGAFLVLDECFNDFLEAPKEYTMKPYLEEFPQMFLLKAFTKKYAMAGVRLGYGICASPELLEEMKAVSQPWNVSVLAQEAGLAALKEKEYVRTTLSRLLKEREVLLAGLRRLGLSVYGSKANYLFFQADEDFGEACLKEGIYLRDCGNYQGLCRGYYRIAVRTGEENQRLLQVFEQILGKRE